MDDLSRAARREIRRSLHRGGIDLPDAAVHRHLTGYRTRGAKLGEEILTPLWTERDHAGRSRQSDLPHVLWFGHRVGRGLHTHGRGEPARAEEVAAVCALFNLGIVLVDRLCDDVPDGAAALQRRLNHSIMDSLATDPGRALESLRTAMAGAGPELRIVLTIAHEFYRRAHRLTQSCPDGQGWHRLNELLARAYDAQLASVRTPRQHDHDTGEAKSTLPFEIMFWVGRLGEPTARADRTTHALAADIGTMFWLVDDLADVAKDLRAGAVNAVLADARQDVCTHDQAAVMRAILDGNYLRRVGDRLSGAVTRVMCALAQRATESPDGAELREVVSAYAIAWSG